MQINVIVTGSELKEMGMTAEELKCAVIGDLDESAAIEYVGFNVSIYVIEGE